MPCPNDHEYSRWFPLPLGSPRCYVKNNQGRGYVMFRRIVHCPNGTPLVGFGYHRLKGIAEIAIYNAGRIKAPPRMPTFMPEWLEIAMVIAYHSDAVRSIKVNLTKSDRTVYGLMSWLPRMEQRTPFPVKVVAKTGGRCLVNVFQV